MALPSHSSTNAAIATKYSFPLTMGSFVAKVLIRDNAASAVAIQKTIFVGGVNFMIFSSFLRLRAIITQKRKKSCVFNYSKASPYTIDRISSLFVEGIIRKYVGSILLTILLFTVYLASCITLNTEGEEKTSLNKETAAAMTVEALQEACWKLGEKVREVAETWEQSVNKRIQWTAKSILRRIKS